MKRGISVIFMALLMISCGNEKQVPVSASSSDIIPAGSILAARDIITEVIVSRDTTGDPWEREKVAGYQGDKMIEEIYRNIYDRVLIAKDYRTGEPLAPDAVKIMEKEFKADHSKVGKLSFTEDWYYDPATSRIIKRVKSVVFGYERYDNDRRVLGYKAIFRIEPKE